MARTSEPGELESTLTDRYQTTVPDGVRRALKLSKRDKIRYTVRPGGAVLITRAEKAAEADPVLGRFLDFLARDLENNPRHIRAVGRGLQARIGRLVKNVEVDLDAPLPPEKLPPEKLPTEKKTASGTARKRK